MRVCAVICEYNPFHLGHAYHLRAAREASGADYVLCLMSGALTQRGAFARHDKWLRARAALENGADLVLELPTRFACAPAPDFAANRLPQAFIHGWLAIISIDRRNDQRAVGQAALCMKLTQQPARWLDCPIPASVRM